MRPEASLRARSEELAATLPPLLAQAEYLAGTVLLGDHGRRQAGFGDDFWQYRPVQQGDSRRMIDWRRSARGDAQFVREREWQIAQSVILWVDQSASMGFASQGSLPSKRDRARLLALALAVLLQRGGERVGLAGTLLPPRRGRNQILRLAEFFSQEDTEDYGVPEARAMLPQARAVFLSDFFGDMGPLSAALEKAADRGVRGILMQVLDPAEEVFGYKGRTIFESMGGSLRHETAKAGDLQAQYQMRLAERKDALTALCRRTGWQYACHRSDRTAREGLTWLWQCLNGGGV